MATYYIKPSGNDASNGLTPATAWATIGKVFASTSPVIGGDTVYIAPGAYRELVTAAQTAWTSTVNIIGDPTASLVSWGGIQPGKVRFTSLTSGDTANASSSVMFTASSRGYTAWQNINFEGLLNITSSGNTSAWRSVSLLTRWSSLPPIEYRYLKFSGHSGSTNRLKRLTSFV